MPNVLGLCVESNSKCLILMHFLESIKCVHYIHVYIFICSKRFFPSPPSLVTYCDTDGIIIQTRSLFYLNIYRVLLPTLENSLLRSQKEISKEIQTHLQVGISGVT